MERKKAAHSASFILYSNEPWCSVGALNVPAQQYNNKGLITCYLLLYSGGRVMTYLCYLISLSAALQPLDNRCLAAASYFNVNKCKIFPRLQCAVYLFLII